MSTVKTNNVQVGNSGTASNNFTWYQPTVPDGTVRLGQGNSGATTSDILVVSSTGLSIGGSSIPASRIVQGTAQTTNGAGNYGYTGLPSWVKRITLILSSVQSNSAACYRTIQLGTSSGYVTSGYASSFAGATSSTSNNSARGLASFYVSFASADATSGIIIFDLLSSSSNTWVSTGVTQNDTGAYYVVSSAGLVTLPGTLDRIQLVPAAGAFNGGTVNIIYEG